MANRSLHMNQVEKILEFRANGHSIKKIGRLLGISKNTVRKYLRKVKTVPTGEEDTVSLILASSGSSFARERTLGELLPGIVKELGVKGVSRALLWEEYKQKHPDGFSYGRFCERIKRYRMVENSTIKINHKPGYRLQIDFTGKKLDWIDKATGELIACEILVCTFPFSGYTHVCAVPSQQQQDFIEGINRAAFFFGGLAAVLLSDNLKSYVKRANRYEPTFTDLCVQLSIHYGVELEATRAGKPKDKGSVERHVQVAYNSIFGPLRNRKFFSMQEMNEAILEKVEKLNAKNFQGKSYSRKDKFEQEEKPFLQPLPNELFEVRMNTKAKVQRNYHVILGEDKHQYSVPYQFIGKTTQITYTSKTVEVFIGIDRIASHQRNRSRFGYSTKRDHMPQKHSKYLETRGWDAQYFRSQADEIGSNTRWAIDKILSSKQLIEQTYNSCLGVLRLTKKFSAERLENACIRARSANRANYGMIRNILNHGMDKLPDQDQQALFEIPFHSNIRGPSEYT